MTAKRNPGGRRIFISHVNPLNELKRQRLSSDLIRKHKLSVSHCTISEDLHKESVKFNSKVKTFNQDRDRRLFYKKANNLYHIKYVLDRQMPTSRKAIIEAKELLEKASHCDDFHLVYYSIMQCADIATPDEKLVYEALLEERKNLLKEKRLIQAKHKAEINAFIKDKKTEIVGNEAQLIKALRNKGYVVRKA